MPGSLVAVSRQLLQGDGEHCGTGMQLSSPIADSISKQAVSLLIYRCPSITDLQKLLFVAGLVTLVVPARKKKLWPLLAAGSSCIIGARCIIVLCVLMP